MSKVIREDRVENELYFNKRNLDSVRFLIAEKIGTSITKKEMPDDQAKALAKLIDHFWLGDAEGLAYAVDISVDHIKTWKNKKKNWIKQVSKLVDNKDKKRVCCCWD